MIKLETLDNVFLTSDTHLGHANILKYTDRPYNSVAEMDLDLIEKWNRITNEDSIIFHLGDFTLGGIEQAVFYFEQLKGTIYFLVLDWHHDSRWLKHTGGIGSTMLNEKIKFLPPIEVLELPLKNEHGYHRKITLSHYPLASWEGSFHGQFHAHGHIHSKPEDINPMNTMDVGVDKWKGNIVALPVLVDIFLNNYQVKNFF